MAHRENGRFISAKVDDHALYRQSLVRLHETDQHSRGAHHALCHPFLVAKPSAEIVRVEMIKKIMQLLAQLRKSITWDCGKEMAQHRQFTIDSGIQIYFCDPRSPWQRGSNENTNGLLRQYLPKGTDLTVHTEEELDAIAEELNNRSRQSLGWVTPLERFAEVVAMTG